MFTFPSKRAYSSRTSCSRSVTSGWWEGRRKAFSVPGLDSDGGFVGGVVLREGVGVISDIFAGKNEVLFCGLELNLGMLVLVCWWLRILGGEEARPPF